jgi:hypothetical protein
MGGYWFGLIGIVGTMEITLLAAASVATAAADGVLVLPIRPANGGMRNGD